MKKNLIYILLFLIMTINISSCLKYKQLSDISGLEMDVQGATPLFSYALNIKDLFFKTAGYDSTKLQVDENNRIYFWTQDIAKVNATISATDSLYKNISVGRFIGKDSVSLNTSGLGNDPAIIANGLAVSDSFTFPSKTGTMILDNNTLNIIQLNNIVGKIKLKISNAFVFPVKIEIAFPELVGVPNRVIDTLARLSSEELEIDISGLNWVGTFNNVINYTITTTIRYLGSGNFIVPELTNLGSANTKVEDTLWIDKYDAIFGNVGSERYLFTDNMGQKINITDPFILNPNNSSTFSNISLKIDYFNHTLGIAVNAKLYDAFFKMKNGTLKKVLFLNTATNTYTEDTFTFPSKIDPMVNFNSPTQTSFLLDSGNTNFRALNLDLLEVDSLLYKVSFYSPKDGSSQDVNSFITQPSSSNFVNNSSGTLFIPYILSSKIFIDTSKTSVVNIPEQFYKNIENIIKDRNKNGELQEVSFSMMVENYSIFSVNPQVYFMNNNQIVDSFSNGKQTIPAARLSVTGIVRIPTTSTITKKLTPAQWQQFSQCNRLTSSIFFETSTEVPFPAITNDMSVKFYFKIENISFKYLIK